MSDKPVLENVIKTLNDHDKTLLAQVASGLALSADKMAFDWSGVSYEKRLVHRIGGLSAEVYARELLLRDISNWLVCEAIATPEDMAQSFTPFREAIDQLLAGGTVKVVRFDTSMSAKYADLALELLQVKSQVNAQMSANQVLRDRVVELENLPTSLPDNLISHRRAWLSGLERVAELEPLTTVHEEDTRGYWKHELAAMHDMYADLDRKMAEPYPFTEPLSLTSARGIPLRLEFDAAEGGCRTGESEEDFIRIDTIENAEAIAQHLLGWVRSERARRVTESPSVREKE